MVKGAWTLFRLKSQLFANHILKSFWRPDLRPWISRRPKSNPCRPNLVQKKNRNICKNNFFALGNFRLNFGIDLFRFESRYLTCDDLFPKGNLLIGLRRTIAGDFDGIWDGTTLINRWRSCCGRNGFQWQNPFHQLFFLFICLQWLYNILIIPHCDSILPYVYFWITRRFSEWRFGETKCGQILTYWWFSDLFFLTKKATPEIHLKTYSYPSRVSQKGLFTSYPWREFPKGFTVKMA